MNKKFSILHISDLHRIAEDNVDCLLSSFLIEKEKYESLGIPTPAFIVVSGDVVQGSKDKDKEKAKQSICQQYKVAHRFLAELANLFFDGDRTRIIIVPGNHDVSQYISRESFDDVKMPEAKVGSEQFEKELKKQLSELYDMDAMVRWSWEKLLFQKVSKKDIYESRFDDFVNFYNTFYEGKLTIDGNCDEYSSIRDFEEYNIAFVCLNSCYHLDHLNDSGYISPRALARLTGELIRLKKQGYMIIAVWHHHTNGHPKASNYLDNTILDNIVENGVQLVLHGHQHVSGIINSYRDVFSENKLWLVSAGTLYGNRSDVVTGNTRQYNILVVNMGSSNCKITLHSRKDDTLLNATPVWVSETIGKTDQNKYDIHITLNEKNMTENTNDQHKLIEIMQQAEKTGDFVSAISELCKLDTTNRSVRTIILDYASRIQDDETILRLFVEPQSAKEAITVLDVIERKRDVNSFENLSKSDFIINCKDASVKELLQNIRLILKL